jgi:large subunit ribosomal protein L9
MQVILQENVSNLGFVGDVVNVKNGYARNFLFPKKLALNANTGNVAQFEHHKRIIEVKKATKKKEATELKKRLEALAIVITHAAAEGEKLFGSVTAMEIHDKIKEAGYDIDRKLIKLEVPIRTIGEHSIEIKLHQEVQATINIKVEKQIAEKQA